MPQAGVSAGAKARHPLTPLFDPDSIAVVGASERPGSVGGVVFANLLSGGFPGRVQPVNPKHATVRGVGCVASLRDLAAPVDLAVIATPAAAVEAVVQDCGAAGVPVAIVLSAGFAETGDAGRAAQDRLRQIARRAGVRLLGPNCVGLLRPGRAMNATFLRGSPPPGGLALVSQSGAICAAIADGAAPNHLGFSAMVSLGNAADIDTGELVGFLAADPATRAILLYLEGVGDASSFVSALRQAARAKPVVVLKAGRHAGAARAAATHTGALLGSDAVFDAALERTGAVRATTFGQLFAAAELLSARQTVGGDRLCILTNGGGAGVLAADRAEELGLTLPAPSPATLTMLDAHLPSYWSHGNPVDVLGDAGPDRYGAALTACLADPAFDGVVALLTPQAMTDPGASADALIAAAAANPDKPVLACWMGETSAGPARARISAAGVADYALPERAVDAFGYLARHAANRRLALELPGPRTGEEPDIAAGRRIVEAALSEGRAALTGVEARDLLAAFRIPVLAARLAADPESAARAALALGLPVAVKVASPDISHKTDVGGVALGLGTADAVRDAAAAVLARARAARPEARIDGVTVEPMASLAHGRELLLGVSRDPVFGPSLVFGAGGTAVEVMRDTAVALPPLTSVLAERMIGRTRIAAMLGAFRGAPAVDHAAVVDAMLRLSDLVCEVPQIVELDINPLIAAPAGVLALDVRVAVAPRPATADPYGHLAIAAWPRHLRRQTALADGTPIVIRPIRPEDAERERAFVEDLSPLSRRMRFLHKVRELTPGMLAQFLDIDYRHDMALVATESRDGAEQQVAIARFAAEPDGASCEFAVVVTDRMQRRGIATILLSDLIAIAESRGLQRMYGRVLAENEDMLTLARGFGFTESADPDDPGVVLIERALEPRERA